MSGAHFRMVSQLQLSRTRMVPAVRSQNQQEERILGLVCNSANDPPAGFFCAIVFTRISLSICCTQRCLRLLLLTGNWPLLEHRCCVQSTCCKLYDLYPIFCVHRIPDQATHSTAGIAGTVNDRQGQICSSRGHEQCADSYRQCKKDWVYRQLGMFNSLQPFVYY